MSELSCKSGRSLRSLRRARLAVVPAGRSSSLTSCILDTRSVLSPCLPTVALSRASMASGSSRQRFFRVLTSVPRPSGLHTGRPLPRSDRSRARDRASTTLEHLPLQRRRDLPARPRRKQRASTTLEHLPLQPVLSDTPAALASFSRVFPGRLAGDRSRSGKITTSGDFPLLVHRPAQRDYLCNLRRPAKGPRTRHVLHPPDLARLPLQQRVGDLHRCHVVTVQLPLWSIYDCN